MLKHVDTSVGESAGSQERPRDAERARVRHGTKNCLVSLARVAVHLMSKIPPVEWKNMMYSWAANHGPNQQEPARMARARTARRRRSYGHRAGQADGRVLRVHRSTDVEAGPGCGHDARHQRGAACVRH